MHPINKQLIIKYNTIYSINEQITMRYYCYRTSCYAYGHHHPCLFALRYST